MTYIILSDMSASITELKKNPMRTVAAGEGLPVLILNRNEPVFYCIPAQAYETLMDYVEDLELNAIVDSRKGQGTMRVSLDDL
ncbi:type II toxin-antitoxin system Phd/YefM family antitoxin [Polynucleobacter rarus]|uniref:type II toxin-antitoxin system Phd/YefM family antitoxin n=1 Tax=Polynucleobacter rarus TaxID=556055 RepID=UPI000D3E83A8|nr:type II toxin-antitoxin system Phd/YefM family antitoxin [Polynucleobacter rarus]